MEWSENDISLPGMANDLVLNRINRGSVTYYDGPMAGWDFNWNSRLTKFGSGYASFELDDCGRKETYVYDGTHGTWTPPAGRYETITASDAAHITRTDKYGIEQAYLNDSPTNWLHLASVTDLHGNQASFKYGSAPFSTNIL